MTSVSKDKFKFKVPAWPFVRVVLLFFAGLAMMINESIIRTEAERLYIVMGACVMMGLPLFLRTDEKRQEPEPPTSPPPPPSSSPSPPRPEQPVFTTPDDFMKWFAEQIHSKDNHD